MWWIVDNVGLVLLVLSLVALCFGAAWWISRNNRLLLGVGVPLALMLVAVLLALFIVTDRKQLVRNIETMRDLVNSDKIDEAIQYFDDEVHVVTAQGVIPFKKTELKALTKTNLNRYGIKQVVVNSIEVDSVARPNAKVTFVVGPEDTAYRGRCTMEFVLSPDGKWRARKFGVESYIGGQKSDQVIFPF